MTPSFKSWFRDIHMGIYTYICIYITCTLFKVVYVAVLLNDPCGVTNGYNLSNARHMYVPDNSPSVLFTRALT